jgi:catalase
VAGRKIGIVVDSSSDLGAVSQARQQVIEADMVPVVVAPRGGDLGEGVEADRSYLTARSVEFDAIVLAGPGAPAPDAAPGRDAKAGAPVADLAVDSRVALLLSEAFRHAKALGTAGEPGWLEAAGIPAGAEGVVTGSLSDVIGEFTTLLATHRVWDRFPATVGSSA